MKIAVLGAGIGGLAASALLADAGHTVNLFEAYEEARPVGAGLLLQPPGQAVLQHLGILEPIAATSSRIDRLQSKTHTGRTLLDVAYDRLAAPARHGLGIRRPVLHDALLKRSLTAGVTHQYDHTVTGIDNEADGAWVRFVSGRAGPFDLVIVATGSRTDWLDDRQFGRRAKRYPWGCLWATVPLPDGMDGAVLHQRCLSGRFMAGLLPTGALPDGRTSAAFYWSVRHDRPKPSLSDVRAQMQPLWPEGLKALEELQAADLATAVYYDVWAKRPHVGRTVLIGDAAHGTSPQLGQGCTGALLDAWALATSLKGTDTLATDLKAYCRLRRGHQRYIRYASIGLTPVFQTDSKVIGASRDFALGTLSSLPGARLLAAKSLASDVCLKGQKAPD